MCGIYASVSKKGPVHPTQDLKQLLCNRGPDHLGQLESKIETSDETVSLSFSSTVLALRGGHVVEQPLTDAATGSVLCWNGEAWMIGQEVVQDNDGLAILNLLASSTLNISKSESISRVLEAIQSISGPFAFVFFDKIHELLYFGRDCLGRRSLLFNAEDIDSTIQFSSVARTATIGWREVEADGVYVLALSGSVVHLSLSSLPEEYPENLCFQGFRTSNVSNDSHHVQVS
jgi:asparagine synthetase B (glutamine-hydrolysing)